MKTTLLHITMFLVLATAALTACVPNLPKKQQATQTSNKNVQLSFQYQMYCECEVLDYADIEVTYNDRSGKLATDTITIEQKEEESQTMVEWHANLGIDTVPFRVYLSYRYLPKPGIDVDADKFIAVNNTMHFSSVNSDRVGDCWRWFDNPIQNVRASKLKDYFDLINENRPTLDCAVQCNTSPTAVFEFELVEND